MASFLFKGTETTYVELPGGAVITVAPGEVVELAYKDLAKHLWEEMPDVPTPKGSTSPPFSGAPEAGAPEGSTSPSSSGAPPLSAPKVG